MENNNCITSEDILNSLKSLEDLYSGIPIEMLKGALLENSLEEKNNFIATKCDNKAYEQWGNRTSQILIFGFFDDRGFSKDEILWKNILTLGMKLKEEDVFCVKSNCDFEDDIKKYKYILSLGEECKNFLMRILKVNLILSNITIFNDMKIMPTFSINNVQADKNIKKIFWNDLKKFLIEIQK